MTLYLYKIGTNTPVSMMENVTSYTDNKAVTEDGTVYAPFAEDYELSSKPDCSESLRAKYRAEHPSAELRMEALESVSAIAFVTLSEAGAIDNVTAAEHADLFTQWACTVSYKTGQIRRYNGKLYRCVQDHTSQADWTPEAAPSLWATAADPAEEWPEWSQPVGAHDAYNTGDKVSHNGKRWTSSVDGNVWEPGVYGWEEAEVE